MTRASSWARSTTPTRARTPFRPRPTSPSPSIPRRCTSSSGSPARRRPTSAPGRSSTARSSRPSSRSRRADVAPLVCPACGTGHEPAERFCTRCGTPLVHAPGAAPPIVEDEARARARKVRPQYAEGALVRVAGARNQAEGELIQGLLLEEGVPSLMRRSGGFDVPDFLASGPRDILVPASGAAAARDIIGIPESLPAAASPARPEWVRALAATLAVLIVALVAAGLYAAIT